MIRAVLVNLHVFTNEDRAAVVIRLIASLSVMNVSMEFLRNICYVVNIGKSIGFISNVYTSQNHILGFILLKIPLVINTWEIN